MIRYWSGLNSMLSHFGTQLHLNNQLMLIQVKARYQTGNRSSPEQMTQFTYADI